ncbi:MAG: fluoride efflux transporter CrcB [Fluviibacter sp.]|jgi:CrcB protein
MIQARTCKNRGQSLLNAILAISVGSALGALLRWQLGLKLNEIFPTLPPGTLVANLVGGYIIGLAVAYFANASEISPEWRLFIITGFCGGLTTFSTFSAEVVSLLQAGRFGWASATVAIHVSGSLIATIAGLFTWQLVKHA